MIYISVLDKSNSNDPLWPFDVREQEFSGRNGPLPGERRHPVPRLCTCTAQQCNAPKPCMAHAPQSKLQQSAPALHACVYKLK